MAESVAATYNVVYEDIEPFFEWQTDDDFHILVVMLPGFRRDQLKVQVTSTPMIKISAQRQIAGNRWRRVYKEFSVPSDSDPNDIAAKFEAGTLKIKFPKLITPSPERNTDNNAQKNNNDAQFENQAEPKADDDQVSDKSQKSEEPTEKVKTDHGVTEKNGVHREKSKLGGGGGDDDDEDSGKTNQKGKEPVASEAESYDFSKKKGKINNGVDEKKAVHEEDKAKSKGVNDEDYGKTNQKEIKESVTSATSYDFSKKDGKINNGVDEKKADHEEDKGKSKIAGKVSCGKNVSRLKTRLLDFTLSLRPTRAEQEGYNNFDDYKEGLTDLVTRMKKMKNLVNLMVAALLVVAFVLYLKNVFKSSLEEGSEKQEL